MAVVLTAIIAVFIIAWFICFAGQSGITFNGRLGTFITGKRTCQGEGVSRKDIVYIFVLALIFRIAVYIASVVYLNIFSDETTFGFSDFLSAWNRWDAPHYIDLAKKGYEGYVENGQHLFLVFFPLYPWLLRALHVVIRDWEIACLVLSCLAYAAGACFFYALVSEEYGKRIAWKSLVLLSVYPFSFFFGGMMTESLFLCTMMAGFYFVKKHNWLATGLTGILCSLCRVQGVLLFGVAGVEFFVYYKPFKMFKEKEGKEFISVTFGNTLYDSIAKRKMISVTSSNYNSLELELSKLLYHNLQKERIALSTSSVPDEHGYLYKTYDYSYFQRIILFKKKKKAENIQLIMETL